MLRTLCLPTINVDRNDPSAGRGSPRQTCRLNSPDPNRNTLRVRTGNFIERRIGMLDRRICVQRERERRRFNYGNTIIYLTFSNVFMNDRIKNVSSASF